jgi:hypothetical protein
MALQLGAVRDALIEAGASNEKAAAAAEELAGYENRLAAIEHRLTAIEGKVNLLSWMVGFNLVLTAGVLVRLLH